MAFGSGVLISALCFELIEKDFHQGGLFYTCFGFFAGAVIYTLLVRLVNKNGAQLRKRSGDLQLSEAEAQGSGKAIAIGALLDGILESIVIGLGLISGHSISMVTVLAIFLSNIPEALSSAHGMKRAGRSLRYVFCLWPGIAFTSGVASYFGYAVFGGMSGDILASIKAIAAGGILAMIVTTLIPEAYEQEHDWAGIVTVLGFLTAFVASKT